ncbi:MAG: UDP-N-acetylmuramoyl-tripeptide--D-alanyl-D-alanine ligase [Endomicrobium sp.]|jgi:UDP-N-acetylmuramoyl-tripeptide--D-alanyl-D-alanine ligase|nr:UDP-N-acetylmuramoyl-tripeptide--D-alanyl-D-alanine ligase [Endomicrobium sp.]
MEAFYLKDLVKAVNGKFLIGDPNLAVKSVSIDSRTIKRGQFFFAIQGENFDGHDFIKEAVEREAAGIVYSKEDSDFAKPFPNFPSIIKVNDTVKALGDLAKAYKARFSDCKIIGLTGSNGKTTTKEILKSILSKRARTVSNKGNFNNRIGLPLSVLELKSDVKYAVFEMGTSERGEIKVLSDILKPNAAIITNIGFSHLETFKSKEGVFAEKRTLLDGVAEDGFIVLNNDDPILKKVSSKAYSKIITFAFYGGADVYAKNITLWAQETNFVLCSGADSIDIIMHVRGRFNVLNALAAASAAIGLGFSLKEIKEGIETFTPPSMRMETIVSHCGAILINDAYNSNPSSVKEAVESVCESYEGYEINLVLGDMLELGEESYDYHFETGEFINGKKNVKSVYLIGEMTLYIKDALNKKNVFHANNQSELLNYLRNADINRKSVFLFKASRGMKLEKIYAEFYDYLEKRNK